MARQCHAERTLRKGLEPRAGGAAVPQLDLLQTQRRDQLTPALLSVSM